MSFKDTFIYMETSMYDISIGTDTGEQPPTALKDKSASGEVKIPSSYEGKKISEIGYRAFSNSKITAIFIPYTITKIGMYAFELCENLAKVEFDPKSLLTEIGIGNFFQMNSIEEIVLPGFLQRVGDMSLSINNNIKKVVFCSYTDVTGYTYRTLTSNGPDLVIYSGYTSVFCGKQAIIDPKLCTVKKTDSDQECDKLKQGVISISLAFTLASSIGFLNDPKFDAKKNYLV